MPLVSPPRALKGLDLACLSLCLCPSPQLRGAPKSFVIKEYLFKNMSTQLQMENEIINVYLKLKK